MNNKVDSKKYDLIQYPMLWLCYDVFKTINHISIRKTKNQVIRRSLRKCDYKMNIVNLPLWIVHDNE
jgi:hypothetical protein